MAKNKQLNKWVKEVRRLTISNYKETDDALFSFYKDALKDMKVELKQYVDSYDDLSFSKRLEVERQIQVANRIDEILIDLNKWSEAEIRKSIEKEADFGYYGSWYALESAENIQLDFAMLPEKYIEQLVNKKVDGKNFSERLYKYRDDLAEKVTSSLLNGAAKGRGYRKVAKEVGELTEASYKQALRIARTEGGRVQSTAKQKAYVEAKEKGIRIQKQWLATLDKKTRHQHQILDGQVVGVEEQFEFGGYKADGPRLFGVAGLDINCRCTTITVVNGISPDVRRDNESGGLVEYKNYNEWAEAKGINQIKPKPAKKSLFDADTFMSHTNMKKMVGEENYKQFINHLNGIEDEQVKSLFAAYGDKINFSKVNNGKAFAVRNEIQLNHDNFSGTETKPPLQTVYHEFGHAIDSLALERITGETSISTGRQVKKKVLRKTITVDEKVGHITGHPKYKLKESIQRDIWEHVNGKDLPMVSDLGPRPRKKSEKEAWFDKRIEISKKSEANFEAFEKAIKKEYADNKKALGALSDMYESTGFSINAYPLGSGHGKKYWDGAGSTETEFIAHYMESITTNADSYDLLNRVFPNAMDKTRTIIDDMLKASD